MSSASSSLPALHALGSSLSSFFGSLSSSAQLRGLLLAGTVGLAFKALNAAAAAKGYKKKLPARKVAAAKRAAAASATASASEEAESILSGLKWDAEEFVTLLSSFIAHTEKLQNNPPALIPREDLIADLVIKFLEPYADQLEVRRVCYVEGRSNVIVKYNPSKAKQVVSFVGSHMDVVTANPAEFKRPPFQLTREGDIIYGRGVTDCLGHVAMLCCLFKQLAIAKPALRVGVASVFIANEENSTVPGVGIDALAAAGELEFCRKAPLFWIDSADVGPTVGTAGVMTWSMKTTGFSGHSGVPQNAVNALSLSMRAIEYIQKRFYSDFPYTHECSQWLFSNASSLKPTRCEMPPGGVTNIPREVTIKGDVRFVPFVTEQQIKTAVAGYVADLNEHVIRNGGLPGVGGVDRFVIPDPIAAKRIATEQSGATVPMLQGVVEWEWTGHAMTGVACDMDSTGFKALCDAIYEVTGQCKPFALTGSLPIIADLKAQGMDVQVTGFGAFDAYHAANEYATISGFETGTKIVTRLIDHLNTHMPQE